MTQLRRAINVTRFSNIHEQTIVNIIYTYHLINQKIKDQLAPYHITPQQYNVLSILKVQYPSPSTINFIKSRILDKMSDTSRIVDRLIQKELVAKKINSYDKRAVDIIITDTGLALLKKISKEVMFADLICNSLNDEEAKQLNILLEKLSC